MHHSLNLKNVILIFLILLLKFLSHCFLHFVGHYCYLSRFERKPIFIQLMWEAQVILYLQIFSLAFSRRILLLMNQLIQYIFDQVISLFYLLIPSGLLLNSSKFLHHNYKFLVFHLDLLKQSAFLQQSNQQCLIICLILKLTL